MVTSAQMIKNYKRAIQLHTEHEDWKMVELLEQRLANEEKEQDSGR